MPRTPKRPRDANQRAWQVVQEATGQIPKQDVDDVEPTPAAIAGALGGRARAAALRPATRRLIAKKAAKARWTRKK